MDFYFSDRGKRLHELIFTFFSVASVCKDMNSALTFVRHVFFMNTGIASYVPSNHTVKDV